MPERSAASIFLVHPPHACVEQRGERIGARDAQREAADQAIVGAMARLEAADHRAAGPLPRVIVTRGMSTSAAAY